MGVQYILRRIQQKMGLDPSDPGSRGIMLDYLNEAANELYQQADVEGSMQEVVLQMFGNQQLALPNYIYRPRGVREMLTLQPWTLLNQTPRMQQGNWIKQWRAWTIKGYSPIKNSLDNEGPLVLTVSQVENPPMTVTIVGKTAYSSRTVEVVKMTSTQMTTQNIWIDELYTIFKSAQSLVDLTVWDFNGPNPAAPAVATELAKIPNNQLVAPYLIIDVSKYPFNNASNGGGIQPMEVLFKARLPYLSLDTDEYPAPNMDNILVNKTLQLWAEEKGDIQGATAYDAKATRSLARNQMDAEQGEDLLVTFVKNPHDELLWHNPTVPARFGGYRRYWGTGAYGY